ncbi:MAG TPA: ABC transporter substrate-binding protein [Chloroflexota bacterium]|nr:ABC transporter substrate-binding protein [Chloroflexota bacterium]
MKSIRWLTCSIALAGLTMAGCGRPAAEPTASSAAPNQPASPSQAAASKPAASTSAPGSASSSAKPAASAGPKLVLAYSNITANSLPTWSAGEGGYFQKHGLNIELQYLAGGSKTLAALLAGQVQIAENGGGEIVGAVAEGADLVAFATISPVYPYRLEVSKDIQQPADLKGKKMGIASRGGSADIAGRVVLKKFGIDPDKDVNTIVLGDSQTRYAALLNGAIQAAMADPPNTLKIEQNGFHPLFDLAALGLPASQTVQVAPRAWVNANRPTVQALVDAEVEATARAKKDKEFVLNILRKYDKLDDPALLEDAYNFYTFHVAPSLPYPKPEQFTDTIAQLSETNPHVKNVDLSKLLDDSFVKSAADRGLDKS